MMKEQKSNLTVYDSVSIRRKIHTIRNNQVILDNDLALFNGIKTKVLNQTVKRNSKRYAKEFMFQLTKIVKEDQVTNCDLIRHMKFSSTLPFVFTEQGVAMLSAVLRSEIAVKISIQIMSAFVAMRRFLVESAGVFQRLDKLELKQIETD